MCPTIAPTATGSTQKPRIPTAWGGGRGAKRSRITWCSSAFVVPRLPGHTCDLTCCRPSLSVCCLQAATTEPGSDHVSFRLLLQAAKQCDSKETWLRRRVSVQHAPSFVFMLSSSRNNMSAMSLKPQILRPYAEGSWKTPFRFHHPRHKQLSRAENSQVQSHVFKV